MLDLAQIPSGTEFRGAPGTGAYRWLGYVAYPVAPEHRGRGVGPAMIRALLLAPLAGSLRTVLLAPLAGSFRTVLLAPLAGSFRTVFTEPALSGLEIIAVGVESADSASIHCLRAAGFRPVDTEPNFEGIVYFACDLMDDGPEIRRRRPVPRPTPPC